ncbi:alpha/beta hydrolase [Pseudomonas sp. WS 5011]|jgi:acetyl esterase/lipase|uniref:alpha/beta hydrolase n=2 Tax=Pseudomonadales TaxID=72274 RepID=UPI0014762D53|nr:alpha/beta hydrolase [Pseudomonas sp. WS 5011]NMY51680.1 alpha/beta hydrolase [Pseudomonas sp. WS 5011]|tara:strand:+ start:405 stop:1271 length:867 start_codon:yes stop_codon:yes gene_type:complete
MRRTLKNHEPLGINDIRQSLDLNSRRFKNAEGVHIKPTVAGASPAEWLIPEGEQANEAVLYLHGGAYVSGSLESHRSLASNIAKSSKVRVLLVEYRLAPEHPYPAAIDDATKAFEWIQAEHSIPADRIIIIGDSAGGGLTLATAMRLRDTSKRLPCSLICLSPWTDLSLSGESIKTMLKKDPFFSNTDFVAQAALDYAGSMSLESAEISPLFGSLKGLPPIFIQVGSDEILLSDSLRLANLARISGVDVQVKVWRGMWHVWQSFGNWMPESRDAIAEVGYIIQKNLSK